MFNVGQQIGVYSLIRKLGKGGFGEVWLAERRSRFVTVKVAVKLPLDEQVDHEAIRQEATLWEQASGHPNILPIIDADDYDGQIVIVSEYAPDGTLAEKLNAEGKLRISQAVEMTIGILDGLNFLHSKRIIHRDIKPQNILLQGDTPRLADFGISRAMQTTESSSMIVGTDAYMSPESFEGKRNVQTDIWSVGVVFYQMLKGSLPFSQQHPSERMFAILMKDFDPLPDSIPQNLKTIISKALAKSTSERYQTASAMREALRQFLRGKSNSNLILQRETDNLATNSETEIETFVQRPAQVSKSLSKSNPSHNNETRSGTMWKMGTNWSGRQSPSFYNFVRDKGIVIGSEKFRYSIDDLVIVTDGFTVKAIAKVEDEPKPLVDNTDYYILFEKYNVEFEDWVIYAKAEWYELKREDFFQYKVQRGGGRVNKADIREKVLELWKDRDKNSKENNIELDKMTTVSDASIKAKSSLNNESTLRFEREETGLSTAPPKRQTKESDTYWNTRVLTHSILGKHYRTPQNNMKLLVEYLNSTLQDDEIISFSFVAPMHENLRFVTGLKSVRFNAHKPINKDEFLEEFKSR